MDQKPIKKEQKLHKAPLPVFSEVFDNPEDFNYLGMNIAKYFYDHSLVRERDQLNKPVHKKGLLKHDFLSNPLLVVTSFFKLVYFLAGRQKEFIFYGNSNRIIKEGNSYFDSFNFNIVRDIGPKKVLILQR